MVELDIEYLKDTKNYHRFERKDGQFIISVYAPKALYPDKPTVKVVVE